MGKSADVLTAFGAIGFIIVAIGAVATFWVLIFMALWKFVFGG